MRWLGARPTARAIAILVVVGSASMSTHRARAEPDIPMVNPLSGNDAAIKEGRSWYRAACPFCHGDPAGDGRLVASGSPRIQQEIQETRRDRQGRTGSTGARPEDARLERRPLAGADLSDRSLPGDPGKGRRELAGRRRELVAVCPRISWLKGRRELPAVEWQELTCAPSPAGWISRASSELRLVGHGRLEAVLGDRAVGAKHRLGVGRKLIERRSVGA